FFQGISLGLLFVPLTTIAMDPIPKETMGNATSMFNLMRNIGGSVGIASATTILARHNQSNTNVIGSHVDIYNPQARAMIDNMRSGFIAGGSDFATATHQAYNALFGLVQRQAAMISFNEVFFLFGGIFALMLPLLFIMKKPAKAGDGMPVH
ncbi:MAG: EmrB/QacA family drug resistance transporter, partial [Acidobacteriota bacterium]|nr:EmrB/QacA family drug resistance transporter [Acidobacteriota bacterium]